MSFPKIPDINPDIDLCLEDAVNLLLISIALEEISLADLIDAESNKLLFFLDKCNHKDTSVEDVLNLNKSIDSTIKNIIKLQMLLQFKLDNVRELICSTTTTTTTTTSSTTTTTCSKTTTTKSSSSTTSCTTTCSTSTYSTTTKEGYKCGVMGKAKGCISYCCDKFYNQTAYLQVYAFSDDKCNRSVRYEIQKDKKELVMDANKHDIKIECPCFNTNAITIKGNGNVWVNSKHNKCLRTPVKFCLTIWRKRNCDVFFEMKITSIHNPEITHNSGIVKNKITDFQSAMRIYF